MTPRRDVEEEIYAQLYGEPKDPEAPRSMRVIDGDHRRRPVREDPEPEPPRPRGLEALSSAAAAAARSVKKVLGSSRAQGQHDAARSTWAQVLRDAFHSARAQSVRDAVHSARARAVDGLDGRERRLGFGALAVGLIVVVLVAGLGAGPGGEEHRVAGLPPERAAEQAAADSAARAARKAHKARKARAAREAREARRRRARRRRAAAQRRQEERATASSDRAPANDTYSYPQAPETDVVCLEDIGCVPRSSLVRQPTQDHERADDSDRKTVDRPRVRTEFDRPRVRTEFHVRKWGGRRNAPDVDVDVD